MSDPTPGSADAGSGFSFSDVLSALPTNVVTNLGTAAAKAGASGTGVLGSITSNLGNMALIGVGVVLGLGALLIGSRDTIVNVQSKVGGAMKTARMFV